MTLWKIHNEFPKVYKRIVLFNKITLILPKAIAPFILFTNILKSTMLEPYTFEGAC